MWQGDHVVSGGQPEWAAEDAAQHALNLANWRIKLLQVRAKGAGCVCVCVCVCVIGVLRGFEWRVCQRYVIGGCLFSFYVENTFYVKSARVFRGCVWWVPFLCTLSLLSLLCVRYSYRMCSL